MTLIIEEVLRRASAKLAATSDGLGSAEADRRISGFMALATFLRTYGLPRDVIRDAYDVIGAEWRNRAVDQDYVIVPVLPDGQLDLDRARQLSRAMVETIVGELTDETRQN